MPIRSSRSLWLTSNCCAQSTNLNRRLIIRFLLKNISQLTIVYKIGNQFLYKSSCDLNTYLFKIIMEEFDFIRRACASYPFKIIPKKVLVSA